MSQAKFLLPFTCNFQFPIIIFLLPLFTYLIAQHKWWTQKEQVFLLVTVLIYLCLMHNDFVWLYCMLFQCHRNVMEFAHAAVSFSPFLDEGKEQRLVTASCVFPRNAMLSSPPSFLICISFQVRVPSFMYITGACALWSERQYCD